MTEVLIYHDIKIAVFVCPTDLSARTIPGVVQSITSKSPGPWSFLACPFSSRLCHYRTYAVRTHTHTPRHHGGWQKGHVVALTQQWRKQIILIIIKRGGFFFPIQLFNYWEWLADAPILEHLLISYGFSFSSPRGPWLLHLSPYPTLPLGDWRDGYCLEIFI